VPGSIITESPETAVASDADILAHDLCRLPLIAVESFPAGLTHNVFVTVTGTSVNH